jgi:transcriptional regulator with XRE-family HTH domain
MRPKPAADTGPAIRKLRLAKGWTLAELADHSGVAISTLSRVELGQTALNYDKLVRLCRALDVDLQGLVAREISGVSAPSGRRSVVRAGEGQPLTAPGQRGLAAGGDLLSKAFTPIILDIEARTLADAGPLRALDGEAYLLVLAGEAVLHGELYAPLTLKTGDGVYFDGRGPHAIVAGGDRPARVLLVVEGEAPTHA